MSNTPFYPYDRPYASRYTFTSIGKRNIQKAVEFAHTGSRNIVNMGFGDLMADGTIDDKANSNNGDIIRVLATTVQILIDFTSKFPDAEIFITGSTKERTKLYTRILKTYSSNFDKDFIIKGIIKDELDYVELPFEPKANIVFLGFLIKRKW
ncbi:DUF6934 family protein [Puia dinghuensis]|nr:hypothetical protein [Puia dinghuensis]